MSRSGYSEDLDEWALIRWRGAVASAIRGKRGQAFLKELEAALLDLPEKKLCSYDFANSESGEVCALGAVAIKRELDKGKDRASALADLAELFPEGSEAEAACGELGIAGALAKEITYLNDEDWKYSTPEGRYEGMLAWVRSEIVKV